MGVCEYAIGRGKVAGELRINEDDENVEGEEDARLLGDLDEDELEEETTEEDEAVRKGRLILRQFQHNSYHLHGRLKSAIKDASQPRLTEPQLRELCGTRWNLFGISLSETDEGRWWITLAKVWGMTKHATGEVDA